MGRSIGVVAEAGETPSNRTASWPGSTWMSTPGADRGRRSTVGQQMSQAYLNSTTDFRPTGSPFVR